MGATRTTSQPHAYTPGTTCDEHTIMNDDPAATGAVAATSDDFRDITKSTGIALRIKLQEDPDPAIKDKGFNSYKTKPYQEDLLKVMTLFRENEFPALHADGDFEWRSIRLITRTVSLDKSKCSEVPRSLWALPLVVGRDNTVGQPVRLCELYEMSEGDIYLGYEVIKA